MGHMKWVRPFFVLAYVTTGCSVPSFGYQSVAEQTLNVCHDGKLSPGEADVDCAPKDCDSSVCTPATHECAVPTCTDGVLNGAEPTVDCGASCTTKCKVANNCVMPADCATKVCTNLHCVPAAPSGMPLSTVGWLATASESEDNVNVPSNVLDGDLNTHWTTAATTARPSGCRAPSTATRSPSSGPTLSAKTR